MARTRLIKSFPFGGAGPLTRGQVQPADVQSLLRGAEERAVAEEARLVTLVAVGVERQAPPIRAEVPEPAKVQWRRQHPLDELLAGLAGGPE
jgi:hypothetical protein